ncbi:hypothetical protein BU16DRAFT_500289 [Lophium mytilinum]|uniref:Nudix hydrolase domain-containing protein n=1 Tax=Lophium mytilinum TaxID=390894 RepID=A0A6A6RCV9_9PEZI|nr:hypothetical protein BU16DRAFT_500289 [Lophium mytilinum]
MTKSKSYLEIVKNCDNFPYDQVAAFPFQEGEKEAWYQFLLPNDSRPHGYILPWVVKAMPWTSDFIISHDKPRTVQLADSSNGAHTAKTCNSALEKVVSNVIKAQTFKGFNDPSLEPFRIAGARDSIYVARSAASLFGITVRGIHMVVYTRTPDGMKIWVPRRAPTLFSFPNLLDSAVGGGIRADESPFEAMTHEAEEEASLTGNFLTENVRSCGALTYMSATDAPNGYEIGLMIPEVAYLYELEVPGDTILKPNDNEVGKYNLWDTTKVAEELKADQFKPSSAAVMVDFFIRHGIITSENDKDYLRIINHLHRSLPIAT